MEEEIGVYLNDKYIGDSLAVVLNDRKKPSIYITREQAIVLIRQYNRRAATF